MQRSLRNVFHFALPDYFCLKPVSIMAHRLNSPGAVFRNFLEMAFGLMTVPTDPWKEIIKVRETLSPSAGPKSLDHEIQK